MGYESSKHLWTWKDDAALMLELLALGRLKVEKFISKKLSYTRAEEAYELLLNEEKNILGILFCWK